MGLLTMLGAEPASPLEHARERLEAITAELEQARAKVTQLEERREEMALSDEPVHLRLIKEAELEVEHLSYLHIKWSEELRVCEDEERERTTRFVPRLWFNGWIGCYDLEKDEFLSGHKFYTHQDAAHWIAEQMELNGTVTAVEATPMDPPQWVITPSGALEPWDRPSEESDLEAQP